MFKIDFEKYKVQQYDLNISTNGMLLCKVKNATFFFVILWNTRRIDFKIIHLLILRKIS
jgi:uncharacterized ubiquitin-like protein YukD